MAFTDLKALSGQSSAESAPTAAATAFKTVEGLARNGRQSRLVEFRLKSASVANSPTSVSFDIWRWEDGVRDYLTTWVVAGADITAGKVAPLMLETYGNELMATLSAFTGGTSPTFTGTVQASARE